MARMTFRIPKTNRASAVFRTSEFMSRNPHFYLNYIPSDRLCPECLSGSHARGCGYVFTQAVEVNLNDYWGKVVEFAQRVTRGAERNVRAAVLSQILECGDKGTPGGAALDPDSNREADRDDREDKAASRSTSPPHSKEDPRRQAPDDERVTEKLPGRNRPV